MNFPKINHISDLLPFIADNPQFRVQEQDNGTTIVCYMLQDEDTFRGEHEEWYKECRGITFDTATGAVVSRTLHKFQNIGENDETQPHLIPWDKITRIMDKRDGSMITFVNVNGKIVGKTKKTFTSAEAIAATEFLYKPENERALNWLRVLLRYGWTPTFEWTSPRFPIVLLYDKDELTLLQARNNVTGAYMTPSGMALEAVKCPFPIVENLIEQYMTDGVVDYEKIREMQLTREGIEGLILQTDTGEMWKAKTKWYCDLHHSVTFTRWRDVARSVLDDQSDDLKAAFAMTGRNITPIVAVEEAIFSEIERVRLLCEEIASDGKAGDRTPKDMAALFLDHENFKEIMRLFRGQEVNWFEWYLKKYINNWSLQVIAEGNVQMMTELPEEDGGIERE